MKGSELEIFLTEFEKRWRSRQGTHNAYDHNPYSRVGRNEMQDWCNENKIDVNLLLDATIEEKVQRVLRKLRKEFPDEPW